MMLRKALVTAVTVLAHADDYGSRFDEVLQSDAKGERLGGAPGGLELRVEGENNRLYDALLGKRDAVSVLGGLREVGRLRAHADSAH